MVGGPDLKAAAKADRHGNARRRAEAALDTGGTEAIGQADASFLSSDSRFYLVKRFQNNLLIRTGILGAHQLRDLGAGVRIRMRRVALPQLPHHLAG